MFQLPSLPPVSIRGPRAVPFLGATGNLLRFFGDPVGNLFRVHREFGVLATLADRDPAVLCAFSPEHNRQILSDSNRFHNFADLPLKVPTDSAPVRLNTALTSMNGDLHKRHRRLLMPAMQKSAIAAHQPTMASITQRYLARFRPGQTTDVSEAMIELTKAIALGCLFGVEATGKDDVGHLGMRYLEGLTSVSAMLFPFMIPKSPYYNFMKVSEAFEEKIVAMIRERRESAAKRSDALSLLISARDEDGSGLTDAELIGQAAVLFIAGHETTAHTLSWTLFLLSQHPEIYAELTDELSGLEQAPSAEKLNQLPLLNGVIRESMRLLPAAAFFFLRRSTGPFELGSHSFPAGITIIQSPLITQRLPGLYPQPRRFMPKRWEKFEPSIYEYLPFGAGPRMCLGAGFASLVLRVVLTILVKQFRFSLVPRTDVSYKVRGITLGPKNGLLMRISSQDRCFEKRQPMLGNVRELFDLV